MNIGLAKQLLFNSSVIVELAMNSITLVDNAASDRTKEFSLRPFFLQ